MLKNATTPTNNHWSFDNSLECRVRRDANDTDIVASFICCWSRVWSGINSVIVYGTQNTYTVPSYPTLALTSVKTARVHSPKLRNTVSFGLLQISFGYDHRSTSCSQKVASATSRYKTFVRKSTDESTRQHFPTASQK